MRTQQTRDGSRASGGGPAGIWRGMSRWQRACALSNVPLFALYCLSRPAPAPAPVLLPSVEVPYSPPPSPYRIARADPDLSVPDPFHRRGGGSRSDGLRRFRPGFQGPVPLPGNSGVVLPRALRDAAFDGVVELRAHRRGGNRP